MEFPVSDKTSRYYLTEGECFSFKTHLKYISFLSDKSTNLQITTNLSGLKKIIKNDFLSKNIKKRIKLIKTLKKNIENEWCELKKNKEFSNLFNTWILTKIYYNLFHMKTIICVLYSGEENHLNLSHTGTIDKIFKKFVFSEDLFNIEKKISEALNYKYKNEQDRTNSILKKIANYKLDYFQINEKIKNFRTDKNKNKKNEFLNDNFVKMENFFYWYRIKNNYREVHFLEEENNIDNHYEFYKHVYILYKNFYNCYEKFINNLSKKRLNNEILKIK